MEESVAFEKGDAFYKGASLDPATALSHIDEKVQRVLGHLQKDFEGGVCAENLGAKFGGYGSFLPTYERFPSTGSNPKPLQRDNMPSSPIELPSEGVSQKPKTPSKDPPYMRHSATHISNSLRNKSSTSVDITRKLDSCLPSTHVSNQSPLKDETSTRSGNLSDRRSLKVRLKLSSNTAIYSDLGLESAPLLTSVKSTDQSAQMPPISHDAMDESPTKILQFMTSELVSGGVLLSPLNDSLLWLSRKDQRLGDTKSVKKKEKELGSIKERLVNSKHRNRIILEDDKKPFMEDKSENKFSLIQDLLPNKLECTPLSIVKRDMLNSTEEICAVTEVSKSIDPLESTKMDSSGPRSGDDSSKNDKQNSNCTMEERIFAHKAAIFNNGDLVNHEKGSNKEGCKSYAMLKDFSVTSNFKKHSDPKKQKHSQKAQLSVEDDNSILNDRVKIAPDGKNTMNKFFGIAEGVIASMKGSHVESCASPNDKKSIICKSKPGGHDKEENNFRDSLTITSLQQNGVNRGIAKRVSGQMSEGSNVNDCQAEQLVFQDKPNGRSREVVSVKDAQNVCAHDSGNGMTSQVACEGVASDLNDDWVMCDRCQKWRLLPFETKPEHLPVKWLCSMLNWLPGMNRCDISEEETTRARNALYHIPVFESANTIDSQGKKKQSSKSTLQGDRNGIHQVSNSVKDQRQNLLERKTINDKNHSLSNSMKNPSAQQISISHNLVDGNSKARQKVNLLHEAGDAQQLDNKRKRVADPFGRGTGTSTKLKADGSNYVDKHEDFPIYAGRKSTTICVTNMAHRKSTPKNIEIGFSEGTKDTKVSEEKEGSMKKRKLKEWQDDQNCQTSTSSINLEEISECGKSSLLLRDARETSSTSNCDDRPKKKGRVVQISVSSNGERLVDATKKEKSFRKDQKSKRSNKVESQQTCYDTEALERDLGSAVSIAATSSSSKLSCSHKNNEIFEVKGSPMESVSSTPLRKFHPGQARRSEKQLCTDFHHESSNGFLLKREDGDTKSFCSKVGETFEVQNENLFNGNADLMKHKKCCYDENKVEKACFGNASSLNDKVYEDTNSSICFDFQKVKPNDLENNQSNKELKNEPAARSNHDVLVPEVVNYSKRGIPQKHTAKFSRKEENQICKRSSEVQQLSDNELEAQLKRKQHEWSNMRLSARYSSDGTIDLQQKLNLIHKDVNESNPLPVESEKEKSKLLLHSEIEGKLETMEFTNDDMGRSTQNEVNYGHLTSGQRGFRDMSVSSVCGVNSSILAANNMLEKAKELREYADHLKGSGFGFESNEAHFQAALKFLRGASLLDTWKSENGKCGESNQMQVYSDTAKLWEICGIEYEKRQEMAAAALAYKCMEVAHMRVVYCKYSSTNKDTQELQVALQKISQDVDNSSNQMDKATLSRSNGSFFPRSRVIAARTQPNIIHLLDFTQHVNLAMEALRKCHNALAAANESAEGIKNKDYTASVKRAVDFSFQNLEEFTGLVEQAMHAINHSGFSFSGPKN